MQHCYIRLGIKDTAQFHFFYQLIYNNCVLVERISDKILTGRKKGSGKESAATRAATLSR